MSFFCHALGAIVAIDLSADDIVELALDELLANGRQMVDKHLAIEVVALMLHDASEIALNHLVVLGEVLILPLDADFLGALHALVYSGEAQAAFVALKTLSIVEHGDFRVDKHVFRVGKLGEILLESRSVDKDNARTHTHLRSSDANALGGIHGGLHILDKFTQPFIFGGNGVGNTAKYRVTVKINR